MPLDAVELLRASGADGVAGEDAFDVAGAAVGAGGRGYVLGPASWSGAVPQPPVELTYASGHVFTGMLGTFANYGGHFLNIRRNGLTPWTRLGTAQSAVQSVAWDEGAGTVSLNVQLLGEFDPATLPGITGFSYWFRDYTQPAVPPDNGDYQIVIRRATTGGGSPSGSDDLVLQHRYDPDLADFNPMLDTPAWPVRVARRAYPSWDNTYEWQAHDSAAYTNEVASSILSGPNTLHSVWIRYRLRAEYNGGTPGAWTNYGEVSWSDPRPDV